MALRTRAPAKINLTLHVVRRRPDGFHDLESFVAFAGVADVLHLDPGHPLALSVEGRTAEAAGAIDDNLVLRAVRALEARVPGLRKGAFRLVKHLPVGGGVGGGSSDAAAALRLLARLNDLPLDDARVRDAARATGSDVPVCLDPRARMMRGTGDRLDDAHAARALYGVLVNPGIHLETRAVFGAMGLAPGEARDAAPHPEIGRDLDGPAFLAAVARGRNDMERAATEIAPAVAHVLAALAALPGAGLVRMSGSGSTCFALFPDRHGARRGAEILREAHPAWWVKATALR